MAKNIKIDEAFFIPNDFNENDFKPKKSKDEDDVIKKLNNYDINRLMSYLINTVELPAFIETMSTDTKIKWLRSDMSAMCNCPFPHHKDGNASFHMSKKDNGVWLYKCFGCGSAGNIITFFKEYTGEDETKETVMGICKQLNIKSLENIDIQLYETVVNKIDRKKEIESINVLISNCCRLIVRRNYNKYIKWAEEQYGKLNFAMNNENFEEVKLIEEEVSKQMEKL